MREERAWEWTDGRTDGQVGGMGGGQRRRGERRREASDARRSRSTYDRNLISTRRRYHVGSPFACPNQASTPSSATSPPAHAPHRERGSALSERQNLRLGRVSPVLYLQIR